MPRKRRYSEFTADEKAKAAANTVRWREALRVKRRAELDAEREARTPIPMAELAWAAGHFEGEGTYTITRSLQYTSSFVCLTSTDKEVIDFFDARWSATSTRTVPANDRHKAKFEWRLQGERMRNFLLDLQPFLVTEKRKKLFAIALEAYDARRRGARNPGYSAMMEGYREQMAELNRRGPNVVMSDGATVYERMAEPIALEYDKGPPARFSGFLEGPRR